MYVQRAEHWQAYSVGKVGIVYSVVSQQHLSREGKCPVFIMNSTVSFTWDSNYLPTKCEWIPQAPSHSKFASFVTTFDWPMSRHLNWNKVVLKTLHVFPVIPGLTPEAMRWFKYFTSFSFQEDKWVTCSIYCWVSGKRKPHAKCSSSLLFISWTCLLSVPCYHWETTVYVVAGTSVLPELLSQGLVLLI